MQATETTASAMARTVDLARRVCGGSIADFLTFRLEECPLRGAERASFEHYYRSYRRHFGPYLQWHYAHQTEELMRLVRDDKERHILELGSGSGSEALWVVLNGASVYGIEISCEHLSVAEQGQAWLETAIDEKRDCRLTRRSLMEMGGESFDLVYLKQAFHHLEPGTEAIRTSAALVRPGERWIISEAGGSNPLTELQLFRRRGFRTIRAHEGHPWMYGADPGDVGPYQAIFGARLPKKESLSDFQMLPNIAIADGLDFVERLVSGFARPLFTHYNVVLQNVVLRNG